MGRVLSADVFIDVLPGTEHMEYVQPAIFPGTVTPLTNNNKEAVK